MMVVGAGRYHSSVAGLLDNITFVITYPWLTVVSLFLSCYQSTTWELKHPQSKLTHYFIYGPALGLIALAFAPLGLFGYLLHIIVCHIFSCNKFIHMTVRHSPSTAQNGCNGKDVSPAPAGTTSRFTFCTANLLLAPECVVRFNNNRFVYTRGPEVARRLLWQKPLTDNAESSSTEQHVSALFPEVDFFCLQEVWERVWALVLAKELQQRYPHYLYDIGEHKLNVNGCMSGECIRLRTVGSNG